MEAYVFAKYGLPIFDTTGAVITLNSTGQTVYHIGNVVNITTGNGFTSYWASPPRETLQPAMLIRVDALIYFVPSQAVRTPQSPNRASMFALTHGRVNRKIIDYKINEGEALYK